MEYVRNIPGSKDSTLYIITGTCTVHYTVQYTTREFVQYTTQCKLFFSCCLFPTYFRNIWSGPFIKSYNSILDRRRKMINSRSRNEILICHIIKSLRAWNIFIIATMNYPKKQVSIFTNRGIVPI